MTDNPFAALRDAVLLTGAAVEVTSFGDYWSPDDSIWALLSLVLVPPMGEDDMELPVVHVLPESLSEQRAIWDAFARQLSCPLFAMSFPG